MSAQVVAGPLAARLASGSTCSTSGRTPAASHIPAAQVVRHRRDHQASRRCEVGILRAGRTNAAAAPPGEEEKARLASLGGVVTDDAVPEGHKGLHGFLYGDGGAEEHDSRGYSIRHVRILRSRNTFSLRQITCSMYAGSTCVSTSLLAAVCLDYGMYGHCRRIWASQWLPWLRHSTCNWC